MQLNSVTYILFLALGGLKQLKLTVGFIPDELKCSKERLSSKDDFIVV